MSYKKTAFTTLQYYFPVCVQFVQITLNNVITQPHATSPLFFFQKYQPMMQSVSFSSVPKCRNTAVIAAFLPEVCHLINSQEAWWLCEGTDIPGGHMSIPGGSVGFFWGVRWGLSSTFTVFVWDPEYLEGHLPVGKGCQSINYPENKDKLLDSQNAHNIKLRGHKHMDIKGMLV